MRIAKKLLAPAALLVMIGTSGVQGAADPARSVGRGWPLAADLSQPPANPKPVNAPQDPAVQALLQRDAWGGRSCPGARRLWRRSPRWCSSGRWCAACSRSCRSWRRTSSQTGSCWSASHCRFTGCGHSGYRECHRRQGASRGYPAEGRPLHHQGFLSGSRAVEGSALFPLQQPVCRGIAARREWRGAFRRRPEECALGILRARLSA